MTVVVVEILQASPLHAQQGGGGGGVQDIAP